MPPTPASAYQTDIKTTWIKAINAALETKRNDYLREAEMLEEYYGADQKNIYTNQFTHDVGMFPEGILQGEGVDGNAPRAPRFRVRDNAAAKCVQIFVPMFLQGEMVCTVHTTKPFVPPPQMLGIQGDPNQPPPFPPPGNRQAVQMFAQQMQARQQYAMITQQAQTEYVVKQYGGSIMEDYLNKAIKEIGLKEEARPCLRDSLVRGLGAMITEMSQLPNNSGSMITDTYLDDDRIVIDPDCKRIKDAKWVAILCEHNTWEVAAQYASYGITEDMLHASALSTIGDVTTRHHDQSDRSRFNLFRYWKIYSRCGLGARLKPFNDREPKLNQLDSILGDFCYIVVADGCDFPLNITPYIEQLAIKSNGLAPYQVVTSWPIPFYYDKDDPWPFTSIWFHERKGSPWPKAHLSFSIGYLNFMAWVLGFVADKAYRDVRGVWVVDASVSSDLIAWMENGQDEEIIKLTKGAGGKKVAELIEYLRGPDFNNGLIELYEFMERKFQEMSGMTDLLQGQYDRQMRSAAESQVLQSASQLRPQDMAAKVTQWLSRIMRKHAIAARYMQEGKDLVAVLGVFGAQAWDQVIRTKNMQDLFREASFNVETGHGRTPDINTDMENIGQAMQYVFPAAMAAYQGTGDPTVLNSIMREWAKTRQMDPDVLQFKGFLPPPPPNSPQHEAETQAAKEREQKRHEDAKAKESGK